MAELEHRGENPIAWVYTVPEVEAEGTVKACYEAGQNFLAICRIFHVPLATGPSLCVPIEDFI